MAGIASKLVTPGLIVGNRGGTLLLAKRSTPALSGAAAWITRSFLFDQSAPVLSFSDEFGTAGEPDPAKWISTSVPQIEVSGGNLEITTTAAAGYYSVFGTSWHDLRGSSATWHVTDHGAAPQASTEMFLQLRFDSGAAGLSPDWVGFYANNAGVTSIFQQNLQPYDFFGFLSRDPRYYRVREDTGYVVWEYGPDGSSWTEIRRVECPQTWDIGRCRVEITYGQWQAEPAGTTLRVSSVNPGAGGGPQALSGQIDVTFAETGGLAVQRALSGTVDSIEVLTSTAFSVARGLAGQADIQFLLTGATQVSRGLTGTLAETTAFTGSIGSQKSLAGLIAETTAMSGSMASDKALSGSVDTSVQMTGLLSRLIELSSSVDVSIALSGVLDKFLGLSGQADVTFAMSAQMAVARAMAGAIAESTSLTGSLAVARGLSGAATTALAFSGVMGSLKSFAGQVDAAYSLSASPATLFSVIGMSGSVPVTISVIGALGALRALAGSSSVVVTTNGSLGVLRGLSGQVDVVFDAIGSVGAVRGMSGVADAVIRFSGVLDGGTPIEMLPIIGPLVAELVGLGLRAEVHGNDLVVTIVDNETRIERDLP